MNFHILQEVGLGGDARLDEIVFNVCSVTYTPCVRRAWTCFTQFQISYILSEKSFGNSISNVAIVSRISQNCSGTKSTLL